LCASPCNRWRVRAHSRGGTSSEPSQQIRHFGVKLKLSPVREVLNKNRVVVVDDSIVRGTTSRKIVGMIRAAGAREVHMRISSPPTVGPCARAGRDAAALARGGGPPAATASTRRRARS